MICLSSAGYLAWFQIQKEEFLLSINSLHSSQWDHNKLWLLHWSSIRTYSNLMKDAVYRSKFYQSYWDLWYSRYWNKHTNAYYKAWCELRSKIWWFKEFCNSHCVSHFAAFFIVMGTKISIVENFHSLLFLVILGLENRFKNELWLLQEQPTVLIEHVLGFGFVLMILPQVHLRKPCYDFYFL